MSNLYKEIEKGSFGETLYSIGINKNGNIIMDENNHIQTNIHGLLVEDLSTVFPKGTKIIKVEADLYSKLDKDIVSTNEEIRIKALELIDNLSKYAA